MDEAFGSARAVSLADRVPRLPVECEMVILANLKSAKDIAAARAVCKRWKRFVDGHAPLWRNMEFVLPTRCPEEAEKWYRRAVGYGNSGAAALLSLLYLYGFRCVCHPENSAALTTPKLLFT